MKYISSKDAANRWGITQRRVVVLAGAGRIQGATRIGKGWMIPDNVEKPDDGRTRTVKTLRRLGEDQYHFPLLGYKIYTETELQSELSPDEQRLYQAQLLAESGDFEAAQPILENIIQTIDNKYLRMGAYYPLYSIFMYRQEFAKAGGILVAMKMLFRDSFSHKDELRFLLLDLEAHMEGEDRFADEFTLDPDYSYSDDIEPYLVTLSAYASVARSLKYEERVSPVCFELAVVRYERARYIYPAILIRLYVSWMYALNGNMDRAVIHAQKAISLCVEYNMYVTVSKWVGYSNEIFKIAIRDFPDSIRNRISELSRTLRKDYSFIFSQTEKARLFQGLTDQDFRYIGYATEGFTNKEIAKLDHITEATVSGRYVSLAKKVNVRGKKELIRLFVDTVQDIYKLK